MPIISVRVSSQADNCSDVPSWSYWSLGAILGCSGGGAYNQLYRFNNITIPKGATINSAKITQQCGVAQSATTCKVRIKAHNVANSVAPVDHATFAAVAAAVTAAYADWTIGAWVANTNYDTPSISAVIQEIVNRADWKSGSSLSLILFDNGSTNNAYRSPRSYANDPVNAALLTIDYTAAGGVTLSATAIATGAAASQAIASVITPIQTLSAVVNLNSSATETVKATRVVPVAVDLHGDSTEFMAAIRQLLAATILLGASDVLTVADVIVAKSTGADLVGTGIATAIAIRISSGAASLDGDSTSTVSAIRQLPATAAFDGVAGQSAVCILIPVKIVKVDLAGAASSSVVLLRISNCAITISSYSELTSIIDRIHNARADDVGVANINAIGRVLASISEFIATVIKGQCNACITFSGILDPILEIDGILESILTIGGVLNMAQANISDIQIMQGETIYIKVPILDSEGQPAVINGAVEILYKQDGIIVHKSANMEGNVANIKLLPTDTAKLSGTCPYEVWVTYDSGDKDCVAIGYIKVKKSISV